MSDNPKQSDGKHPTLAQQWKAFLHELRAEVNPYLEKAGEIWGPDAQAWTRQGLAELREVFNPSRDSIAQPVPYGALGQPAPGVITRDTIGQDAFATYSLDDLRGIGREATAGQDNTQSQEQQTEMTRER
ncbi:hypothetical protein [Fimbriiglobus ruber]|uniref:Uncharacterized protein n=1 Tax=Fimbriiglobus ruber TaxID=1908690 RepID=A0A225EDC7_9BACT|nr:hypothetical protein [Fimbriiglobus ruber]OWK47319.1 hypothetical protein FRUB_01018 [Fimbriiglobus ruber]